MFSKAGEPIDRVVKRAVKTLEECPKQGLINNLEEIARHWGELSKGQQLDLNIAVEGYVNKLRKAASWGKT